MIDPKFIVNLKGKDYPLWAGILDAATGAGLRSIKTRVLQVPSPDNGQVAVVVATAEFEDGRVFEDVGDASPANCSAQIATAALRMASTRAKGRCLRDALNVGQTMYEELPDEERQNAPAAANGGAQLGQGQRPAVVPRPAAAAPAGVMVSAPDPEAELPLVCEWQGCSSKLTPNQARLSQHKYRASLCLEHQKRQPAPQGA